MFQNLPATNVICDYVPGCLLLGIRSLSHGRKEHITSYGRGVCVQALCAGEGGRRNRGASRQKKSICQFGELGASEGLPRTFKELSSARYS